MKELSAPKMPTQSLTTLSLTVGNISGLPEKVVNQCQVWHSQQIRKLPMEVAAAAIGDELSTLAIQYGLREKPQPEVLKECISLIGTKFSHLAPPELREAYRQWASGEIDVSASGEMYGGQINARQVGAVLTAYSKARLEIMGRYLSAVGEAKEQEARAQREAEKKAAFEDKFQSDLQNAIETAQSYKDIPAYWFKILEDRGEIELTTAEKWEVYNSCERYAIQEENERIDSKRGSGKLFEQIADRQNIQKVIAEREAVYRHYVLRKRPG
jgi:alkylated DNA nucleotide flippase Atl1